ncbi:MAG: RNA methyltransferase [Alphaproteobacteria bacterium]|nr:RNA methyltransferase [Alphaproteobacteria bacterium]
MSEATNELVCCEERDGWKTPVVAGLGVPLSGFVRKSHETAIDEIVAEWAAQGIDKEAFDDILVYCAERRCIEDEASCQGCRRRSQTEGFATAEDYIAEHATIAIGDTGAKITGPGERTARFASLEAFYRGWAGEECWFLARRALRKLRHGIRRAHIQGEPIAGEGETPAVILIEPQLADNIGMVARAMANFGLDDLRLVAPRDGWPNERARIAASGANYIIDDSKSAPSLGEATGDLNWICATTARQRDLRKPVFTPEQAVAEMAQRIGQGQRCGIMFGREASGLTSAEVAEADALVMIPVNSKFASLNLAQSVLILAYSWILARGGGTLGRVTTFERPVITGLQYGKDSPAKRDELLGFFEHLEADLDRANFFRPAQRRELSVRAIRTMFYRMGATSHEVRTLRGILKALSGQRGGQRNRS